MKKRTDTVVGEEVQGGGVASSGVNINLQMEKSANAVTSIEQR